MSLFREISGPTVEAHLLSKVSDLLLKQVILLPCMLRPNVKDVVEPSKSFSPVEVNSPKAPLLHEPLPLNDGLLAC